MRTPTTAHHAIEPVTPDAPGRQAAKTTARPAASSVRTSGPRRTLALFVSILAFAPAANGQWNCPEPEWLPGSGAPGTDSIVRASIVWDPDGTGPKSLQWIVGGNFNIAGDVAASRVAGYDLVSGQWSSLGSGVEGSEPDYVMAFAASEDGSLYAGGGFTTAGGVPANRVARWDGATWSALDAGIAAGSNGDVRALVTLADGSLIAGGAFSKAGSVTAQNIARWNGLAWSKLGMGLSGSVRALSALPSGEIVAGGDFTASGSVPMARIAKWNGTAWIPIGTGMDDSVHSLLVVNNQDIIAGGSFDVAGGSMAEGIARWNGTSWAAIGSGFKGHAFAINAKSDGSIVVGGNFGIAGGTQSIAQWDGLKWSSVGSTWTWTGQTVLTVGLPPSGDVLVGGDIFYAGTPGAEGAVVTNVARVPPATSQWVAMGTGFDDQIYALQPMDDGDLLAGGQFELTPNGPAARLARRDARTGKWLPMGSGVNGPVLSFSKMTDGRIVMGGGFSKVTGISASLIAQYDGATWSEFGGGMQGFWVLATEPAATEGLYVGGRLTHAGGISVSNVAYWDGATWQALGAGVNGPTTADVNALALLPSGTLVVGGSFTIAGNQSIPYIARWEPTTGIWGTIGSGFNNYVNALKVLPNGDLVAGGIFSKSGSSPVPKIARWNEASTTWSGLGAGIGGTQVSAMTVQSNGDLIIGGLFASAGGQPLSNIARWDGIQWHGLGTGVIGGSEVTRAVAVLANGDIAAGGRLRFAGGEVSSMFALYGCPSTSCYADCDASGQLNIDDFICFQTNFVLGEMSADCDASGQLNIDDFICFQTLFVLGC